jgi:hypothetical protein
MLRFSVIVATLVVTQVYARTKTAAEWKKIVDERLGDVDADWSKDDSREDLENDNDVLYRTMEARSRAMPDLNAMDPQ